MICPNCKKENQDNYKYCSNCGTSLYNENLFVNPNQVEEVNKDQGNTYVIISIICLCANIIVSIISGFLPSEDLRNYLSAITGLCPLAGIVVMIIGRVKYPKNTMLKILMWVIISLMIVGTLGFIILMAWCFSMSGSCAESLRRCE